MTVLVTEINDWSVAGLMNSMDTLTDARFAVLKEGTKVPRVTNYYETQEWNQAVRKAHEWYKKGVYKKDVLTSQEEGRKLLDEGKAFAKMSLMNIDRNGEMEKPEKVYIPLTKTLATTTCASRDLWVIPSASSMPEKAMEMLNLMYTDPDIVNLLQYGIEGVHYTMQEDGTMLHEYNATGKSGYYRGLVRRETRAFCMWRPCWEQILRRDGRKKKKIQRFRGPSVSALTRVRCWWRLKRWRRSLMNMPSLWRAGSSIRSVSSRNLKRG